jgi:hypothetical protein
MANSDIVYVNYPPAISPKEEEYLVQSVKDWSIQNGLAVRPPPSFVSKGADRHTVLATNAPVTLFPSPFPKSCFDHANSIQCAYNELYAAIANDEEWLGEMVKEYEPCLMCKCVTYLLSMHSFTLYLFSVTWFTI